MKRMNFCACGAMSRLISGKITEASPIVERCNMYGLSTKWVGRLGCIERKRQGGPICLFGGQLGIGIFDLFCGVREVARLM
jgi:hypothetical protein